MIPKILIVRGRYVNQYEMQNYEPMIDMGVNIRAVGSLTPIHKDFKFPLIKLFSPVDIPDFPYKIPILNRLCFGDAMHLMGLSKIIDDFRPDVAHGRETYFYFTYQLAKLKAKGKIKRLIVTCSETRPFNHEGIWRRCHIKAYVRQQADLFHALTMKAKRALMEEGVPENKIKVIAYGVNQKRFYPRKSFKSANNKINLLFVGRLTEEKGVKDLVKIIDLLRRQGLKFNIEIIGRGPLDEYLKQLGLKINTYPYSQMPEVYRQADILISLSKTTLYWEELFGMNLIEAMSSAVVPIAYASGAIPKVVKDKDLLVPEGNWRLIAAKIMEFVVNRKLLDKHKQKVYALAKGNYDASRQAAKIVGLYEKLLH